MTVSCRSSSLTTESSSEVGDLKSEKESSSLNKKSKKMEDELHGLRKSHSEAAAEATHFWNLHMKGIMDYSRKKVNFEKELEEL